MVWPDNIDSGRSNSQLGDRSRCCRHCNLVHLLSIHSLKQPNADRRDARLRIGLRSACAASGFFQCLVRHGGNEEEFLFGLVDGSSVA
jgi:hypothetical protein